MSTLKVNTNAKMVIKVRHLYKGVLFPTDAGVSGNVVSVFKQRKHVFLKIPGMFRLETFFSIQRLHRKLSSFKELFI